MEEELRKARRKAIRLLSMRARTEEELRRALVRADYSTSVVETTLEELRRGGAVNDTLYAEAFVEERRRLKGHAPVRIEMDLRARGVDRETARRAAWGEYEDPDCDAGARLLDEGITLLRHKQVHYEGLRPEVARRRMASVLGRAGYPAPVARDAVEAVIEEMESEGLLVIPSDEV